jgi:hypothetical protein
MKNEWFNATTVGMGEFFHDAYNVPDVPDRFEPGWVRLQAFLGGAPQPLPRALYDSFAGASYGELLCDIGRRRPFALSRRWQELGR